MSHYIENDIGSHVKHLYLISYCYFGKNKIPRMYRFTLVLTDSRLFEEKLSVPSNSHSFLLNDAISECISIVFNVEPLVSEKNVLLDVLKLLIMVTDSIIVHFLTILW